MDNKPKNKLSPEKEKLIQDLFAKDMRQEFVKRQLTDKMYDLENSIREGSEPVFYDPHYPGGHLDDLKQYLNKQASKQGIPHNRNPRGNAIGQIAIGERSLEDLLKDVYDRHDIQDLSHSIDDVGRSEAADDFLKSAKDIVKHRTSKVRSLLPFIGPALAVGGAALSKDVTAAIPVLGEADSVGQGSDIVDRDSLQPYENISDSDKMQQMRRWSKVKDLLNK